MRKTIILLLCSTAIYAQFTSDEDYMKSVLKSAKSQGPFIFTDYSKEGTVDVATGKFGITIPFTSIENEYLTLPINLSYSTSGVKVDHNASEIGIGWDLVAGGQITRKTNGQADDVSISANRSIIVSDITSGYFPYGPKAQTDASSVVGSASMIGDDLGEYHSGKVNAYNEFYSKYFPKPRHIFYNNGSILASDHLMISILDILGNSARVEMQRDIFHVAIGSLNFNFILKIKDKFLPMIDASSRGVITRGLSEPYSTASYYEAVPLDDTEMKIDIAYGNSYDYYSRTTDGQIERYYWGPYIKSFVVTDKKGIQYYFDNFLFSEPESIRTLLTYGWMASNGRRFSQGLMREYQINKWVVSRIVLPNKEIVDYSYEKKRIAEPQNIPRAHDGEYTNRPYNLRPAKIPYRFGFHSNITYRYENLYVKSITTRDKKILFNYDEETRIDLNNGMRLKNMQLFNINNSLVKQFDFISDYLGPSTANNYLSKRLFLSKIVDKCISDKKNIQYNVSKDIAYNFSYYNPESLPSKLAIGFQDLYGYYLGNTIENVYPPFPTLYINHATEGNKISYYPIKASNSITFNGANRIPKPQTVHYGALKEIKFPTKGSLVIEYEPNQFFNDATVERNPIGPGCRVKFLKYLDDDNKPIKTKKYTYQLDHNTSSGISLYKPSFAYISNYVIDNRKNLEDLEYSASDFNTIILNPNLTSKEALNAEGITDLSTLYKKLITTSTHPIGPQMDAFGRDMIYTNVTEEDISVTDNLTTNGSTQYFNHYVDNRLEVNVISGPTNDFTYIPPCSKYVLGQKAQGQAPMGDTFSGVAPRDVYPWLSGPSIDGSIKVKYGFVEKRGKDIFPFPDRSYFNNDDALKIGKTYKIEYRTKTGTYNRLDRQELFNYQLLTNNSYKTSNFDVQYKDTYTHIANDEKKSFEGHWYKSGLYFYLQEDLYTNSKLMLVNKEEKNYGLNGSFISDKTNFQYNKYFLLDFTEKYNVNSWPSTLVKNKFYYPHNSPLSGNLQTELQKLINGNRVSDVISHETFVDGIKTKSLLRTFKEFSVASYNASPISYTINLAMPSELHTKKGNLAIDIAKPDDLEVTYTKYDFLGNLCEYSKNNSGISNVIIWGYNHTLPIAKIENAYYFSINTSLIAAAQAASDTGIEANLLIALNAIRIALPDDAFVTTYTHLPLIGVSTITDPKGDRITYEYDDFNRLKQVKDKNNNILSENEYHYKP